VTAERTPKAHRGADGDEELGAVGVGPGVGHAERVGLVVAQRVVELVVEVVAPDALAAHAGAWASSTRAEAHPRNEPKTETAPVGSPVCTMKLLMTRWKVWPLK